MFAEVAAIKWQFTWGVFREDMQLADNLQYLQIFSAWICRHFQTVYLLRTTCTDR